MKTTLGILKNRVVALGLAALSAAVPAAAQTYEVLKALASTSRNSWAGLIQATDGNLYGTSFQGGRNNAGNIFKIDTAGTTLTTLHHFAGSDGDSPYAGVIQGTDGNLYGTTYQGGANGIGTIFKVDTTGTAFTTLHSFSAAEGGFPVGGLIQGSDGYLYGTAVGNAISWGTIFKIDTAGATFTVLHSFDGFHGGSPLAALLQGTDGNLYGTTGQGGTGNCNYGCGTIFKTDTAGATFTMLHSFVGSDGANPYAGLVQGADGDLYGTATYGGAIGGGTMFKTDTTGATFTILHSFDGSHGAAPTASLIQGTDGKLYGTTFHGGVDAYGTIFQTDTTGATFTTLHIFEVYADGGNPYASLVQGTDGFLYGTDVTGSAGGVGAIFKTDTTGATFITLKSFTYADGANPDAGLILGTDGYLYGTAAQGGAHQSGTIFKTDTAGATFTVLHDFAYSDGSYPYAGLLQGTDGSLYGTTYEGGTNGYGTIFKIDTTGTTFTSLHSFTATDGAFPYARLVQGRDGNLYGTASGGGASQRGTIFKIDTGGTALTTVYDLTVSDGSTPYAGLIQGTDGNLYGTTSAGGMGGLGTIFKTDTSGATFSTLHSFSGGDGENPFFAGLSQGADGNLYGTTSAGGMGGLGTIFKIDTAGASFSTLHSFSGDDGATPNSGVIQGTDGNLYGTTFAGGKSNSGKIFKTDTAGATFTLLHSFVLSDGANPYAGLLQGADGNLYGTTYDGGDSVGVVFRISGCFADVPLIGPFSPFICTVAQAGITAGCGGGNFCPDSPVSRAQMAVFLLKSEHTSSYVPPPCAGIFADVPCPSTEAFPYSDWIEQLATEGITGGCFTDPLRYCPDRTVTRAEMAVLLLKTEHGSGYAPPACVGIFQDVLCTPGVGFSDWIEQLYAEGVTSGCYTDPLQYCPGRDNSRGEMAVFIVKTFDLP